MKTKIKVLCAVAVVLAVITAAYAAVSAGAGSSGDPLVTLSYLTGKFTPQMEEKMKAMVDEKAAELTKKIAAAYNGKSSADMFRNILSEAEKSKRAGTLSNEEIDGFYEQFSPLLDNAKRRQLKSVVERLKRI